MKRSTPTALVLILSLLLSGFSQSYLRKQKNKLLIIPQRADPFAGMDTFAIGLVLGGLRGPLVMALWTSSENQKVDQDLKSIETKIELIRVLQPNFDSVHIFQMWNKAFNLSAQMTSINDKYFMILDALDYGWRIDKDRPDNLNILSSMARIYLDKFCLFEDKVYYDQRVRDESRADNPQNPDISFISSHKFPTLLDKNGRILPQYLQPAKGMKIGPYNGAPLQYLQRYSDNGGFPYGVPPAALAYNYFRRSVDLLKYGNQKHAELSDAVLESRDVYCLYNWSLEEHQRALRIEAQVYDKSPKNQTVDLESAAQAVRPGDPFSVEKSVAAQRLNEAVFTCWRSAQIAQDAIADYQTDIDQNPFGERLTFYLLHQDDSKVILKNAQADRLYLLLLASDAQLAQLPENTSRAQLIDQAKSACQLSIDEAYRMMLGHYVEETAATAAYIKVLGYKPDRTPGRWSLEKVDPAKFPEMRAQYDAELARTNKPDTQWEDAGDYLASIKRDTERLKILNSLP